jgi:hypothetical protein
MSVHDDSYSVSLVKDSLILARAVRCPLVSDHWWLVILDADKEEAPELVTRLVGRLQERRAVQVNVAPQDLRPDLGRSFFTGAGFVRHEADLMDGAPLEYRFP